MATVTRTRKPLQPVHGTCRWILPLQRENDGEVDGTHGLLRINDTDYRVTIIRGFGREPLGFKVWKVGAGEFDWYDIELETWTCDCPDAVARPERPGGCKHVKALRAALAAIGLLPHLEHVHA